MFNREYFPPTKLLPCSLVGFNWHLRATRENMAHKLAPQAICNKNKMMVFSMNEDE